jgi:flavodoxin
VAGIAIVVRRILFRALLSSFCACWNSANAADVAPIAFQGKNYMGKELGRVLVIYFSVGGNTRIVAEKIKEKTAADVYEIELRERLTLGWKLYWKWFLDLVGCKHTELKTPVPDLNSYDTIFVGSPAWGWNVPSPVSLFLSKCDFRKKRVIPFVTHGGAPGKFFKTFEKEAKNADVKKKGADFKNVSKMPVTDLDAKIEDWLKEVSMCLR